MTNEKKKATVQTVKNVIVGLEHEIEKHAGHEIGTIGHTVELKLIEMKECLEEYLNFKHIDQDTYDWDGVLSAFYLQYFEAEMLFKSLQTAWLNREGHIIKAE